MKNKFIVIASIVTLSSGALYAQDANAKGQKVKTKSNIKNDRVCVVTFIATDKGCDIVFNNQDESGGQETGKRQQKPFYFSVNASDNTVTAKEVDNAWERAAAEKNSTSSGSISDIKYEWVKAGMDNICFCLLKPILNFRNSSHRLNYFYCQTLD